MRKLTVVWLLLEVATLAVAQIAGAPEYKPKFRGDPAHSEAEAAALGYMRTVAVAERQYYKKHNAYTTSLAGLVGHGSFTRRMVAAERGDYTVTFHSTGKAYSLALVPRQFDPAHRAFYIDETG